MSESSTAETRPTQNAPTTAAPAPTIIEVDSHAINFGPQHPAAHG